MSKAVKPTTIRFDSNLQVHEIPGIGSLTELEIESIWYHKKEIKEAQRQMIHMTLNGSGGKDYCLRGMEEYLRAPGLAFGRRRTAIQAVLKAQDMQRLKQRRSGCKQYQPELIAKVYTAYCRASVLAAQEMGRKDQREAHGDFGNARFYASSSSSSSQSPSSLSLSALPISPLTQKHAAHMQRVLDNVSSPAFVSRTDEGPAKDLEFKRPDESDHDFATHTLAQPVPCNS